MIHLSGADLVWRCFASHLKMSHLNSNCHSLQPLFFWCEHHQSPRKGGGKTSNLQVEMAHLQGKNMEKPAMPRIIHKIHPTLVLLTNCQWTTGLGRSGWSQWNLFKVWPSERKYKVDKSRRKNDIKSQKEMTSYHDPTLWPWSALSTRAFVGLS